jgi:hypothetical protein
MSCFALAGSVTRRPGVKNAGHGPAGALGKASHVEHDIVKLLRQAVKMASVAPRPPPYPPILGGNRATPPPKLGVGGRLSSYEFEPCTKMF